VSDPIEGMARAMYERSRERWPDMPAWETAKAEGWRSDVCSEHWTDEARAAWAYALATLREPSLAMIHAAYDAGALIPDGMLGWETMLDAFAAEHGIELPQEPASPEPQG
jgi:hypothetical protein